MRKKRILGMFFVVLFGGQYVDAQEQAGEEKEEKGKGKIILTTFANAHTGFGVSKNDRGFELERAYIGYRYRWDNGLEIRGVADFGQSKEVRDMQRIGFIKNAFVAWTRKGWTLTGGLIPTTQFKTQEDFWAKRYVMKSFQDEYKLGSSADIGLSVSYRFCDKVAADVIIVNGEGYKKIQFQNGLQYGAGVTVQPVKGLSLRLYGSYNESPDHSGKGVTNLAAFAGYRHRYLQMGLEYNYQMHTDFKSDAHLNGVSAYATVPVGKRVNTFARWDRLASNHAWNREHDGMAVVAGAEILLGRHVRLAPNFRMWLPDSEQHHAYALYIHASFSL